jgi:DNA-binding MarR family transcriptional regulator/GNAT superfamily N-acetyltransferase
MTVTDEINTVRRFNRSYTQRIGALDDSFLGMGLPLGPIRLLFEIGSAPRTVQALRRRLGLDSGYVSRLLRRLQSESLVEVVPDPSDRRRRLVRLTESGRRQWSVLEERSQARAAALLEPLAARQRARLTTALAEADLLVRAATVTIETVDPASEPARTAVERYFAELHERFAFDATGLETKDAAALRPPDGVFTIALSDGQPVACGGVQTIAPGIGEIKRMWVDNRWRGAGLGSRLLSDLEERARQLGHHTVRLDTNQALTKAIAMYGRAGYEPIDRYNDNPYATHFFEKPLAAAAGTSRHVPAGT